MKLSKIAKQILKEQTTPISGFSQAEVRRAITDVQKSNASSEIKEFIRYLFKWAAEFIYVVGDYWLSHHPDSPINEQDTGIKAPPRIQNILNNTDKILNDLDNSNVNPQSRNIIRWFMYWLLSKIFLAPTPAYENKINEQTNPTELDLKRALASLDASNVDSGIKVSLKMLFKWVLDIGLHIFLHGLNEQKTPSHIQRVLNNKDYILRNLDNSNIDSQARGVIRWIFRILGIGGISMESVISEKKIGFNRGPEYYEEVLELLGNFAETGEMLSKEMKGKEVAADAPELQEILSILDEHLDSGSDFVEAMQKVYELLQSLPNKPKGDEKKKIGFWQKQKEMGSKIDQALGAVDKFVSEERLTQKKHTYNGIK